MRCRPAIMIGLLALPVLALPEIAPAQAFTGRADSIMRAFVGSDAPGCTVAIDSATNTWPASASRELSAYGVSAEKNV